MLRTGGGRLTLCTLGACHGNALSGVEMRVLVCMVKEFWLKEGTEITVMIHPAVTFQCVRRQPFVEFVIVP